MMLVTACTAAAYEADHGDESKLRFLESAWDDWCRKKGEARKTGYLRTATTSQVHTAYIQGHE